LIVGSLIYLLDVGKIFVENVMLIIFYDYLLVLVMEGLFLILISILFNLKYKLVLILELL